MMPVRSRGLWPGKAAALFLLLLVCAVICPASLSAGTYAAPDTVKVGLLIPADALGTEALRGAELAIRNARQREGSGEDALPINLEVRTVEGPWGSGTKDIVDLVFNEEVVALLGGLDGRSAHLIEQVAAKGLIPFVTPWASDPTLSQAFVPWFFRMVPEDRQQARALAREIFDIRGLKRLALAVDTSYDGRMAASAFEAQVLATSDGQVTRLPPGDVAMDGSEGVAFFGLPSWARGRMGELRTAGVMLPFFAPLRLVGADATFELDLDAAVSVSNLTGVWVVLPGHRSTQAGRSFGARYHEAFGSEPSAVSAYAYDGMTVILEAIRAAGPDREAIRDALAGTRHDGVTGPVAFDEHGNRLGPVTIGPLEER
jgi:branched-chain amino acid transport system substrate-binding protein